ncbi:MULTISPECIES: MFS transporter [unclassified Paenibacillus]|uniref:MFS transporter n=1 Tax=unclassified Paenibacillus TaxID=185978 RepID=UPI002406347A|nr:MULTISPECIES: MFS transporter [unclassified Paenibacillus]MDF9839340.1 MFS family permease [Paenibacillus sp. PastF-2]MDF9845921.1 MFS family permease [Paenibacillus sp. PastM-2]MDF9852494.1 MFS family permease [Paenibacillus sp. PastF-1]MDH6477776.1 MFS family permease [Paenibacillus sp. PastH-2]MDH6505515.1 MFS family permease [Paenibacillus sp. PastM-3]
MKNHNSWLLISVGLGVLLNPLNSSMISIALTRLQEVYQLDYTAVSWVVFAFYIASSVAQPVMGKASDLFGRRRIFLAGLVVAFVASMLAPFSPGFGWLIVCRIIQSIGTSMMVAVGMAIVRIHIKENQAAALSVLSVFLSGAAAVGPFIGAVIIGWWDWEAVFWVNIPFTAAGFALAWRSIPADHPKEAAAKGRPIIQWLEIMDVKGIVLFAAGLTSLLLGVLSFESSGATASWQILTALGGLTLLAGFVMHELRTASPFIPLRTFARYPAMTRVNVEYMLVNVLYYALFFGLPSYLQAVRQVSVFQTGILMLSLGLCSLAAAPFAGRWVDRSGPGPALMLSALLMTFGSLWLAMWNGSWPVASICIALAAFGISSGLSGVGLQAALFQSSPKEIIGVASGVFNTSRYFGTILSSLLTGLVMGGQLSSGGLRRLALVLTAIGLLLLFLNRQRLRARFR